MVGKSGLIFSAAWKHLKSLDWTWIELVGDSKIQIWRCRICADIGLAHQYRVIFDNTQKCVRHSRSIKNIRNSAIKWFLCSCRGITIISGLCQTREYQNRNAGLLQWRDWILKAKKSGGGIIREAVLLERAALLERIR